VDRILLAFSSIISVLSFSVVIITGVVSGHGLFTILTRGIIASLVSLPLFLCLGYFLLPAKEDED